MPLFREIDLSQHHGGLITGIVPGSVADEIGLQPGDELLAINDNRSDIIDVQYYSAEEWLELLVRRGDEHYLFEAARSTSSRWASVQPRPSTRTFAAATTCASSASSCRWPHACGAPSISRTTTTATPSSSATSSP